MLNQEVKIKRYIGISLFFIGSIVAISAGAKIPQDGNTYPSTLAVFIIALVAGVIGNILWHGTEKQKVLAELEEHKNDESSNPIILLEKTIPALEKLKIKSATIKGMKFCDEIDQVIDSYIAPFVERRKTFSDILGQARGAEVLLMLAYSERMLNRVWSATSDGHEEEALNSLEDSLVSYKEALKKTQEYL